MKKFNELQEDSGRQYNDLRNQSSEQKDYFTEEVENLKKKQILELKNSINELKTALECIGNRTDQMEERISELEDRNLEMI